MRTNGGGGEVMHKNQPNCLEIPDFFILGKEAPSNN